MKTKEQVIGSLKKALEELDITSSLRLPIIQTIEYLREEPVSEDLEEAAEEYAKSKHTNLALIDIVSLDFKAGAQWKKQQMMDKILFWLNNNVRDWIDMPYDQNAFIRQLENIMND